MLTSVTQVRIKCWAAAVLAASALLTACGGGGGEAEQSSDGTAPTEVAPRSLEVLPISSGQRDLLVGAWPTKFTYLLVRDAQTWEAFWEERRSFLGCSLNSAPPPCASARAPSVDFGRYMLVGVSLGEDGRLANLAPLLSAVELPGRLITISFGFLPAEHPSAAGQPSQTFGLLPRSSLSVQFIPKLCAIEPC